MKWKNLRDTYIKYLKTNQAMSKHGLKTSSYIRYGKWQWASSMAFVKYHTGVLNDSSNHEVETTKNDTHNEEDSDKDEEKTTSKTNNRHSENKKILFNGRKRFNSITDSPVLAKKANTLTSIEHIMIGYAKAIANFSSERLKILTKMKIANIVMEAELEDEQERARGQHYMVYDSDDSLDPSASKNNRPRKSQQVIDSDYSNSPNDSPQQIVDAPKDTEKISTENDDPLLDIKYEIDIEEEDNRL
ncbi:hypothetical protein HW555_008292 [Spodoptera exigua]|uniref:MADF domain-containing protein n=1 Tax=Spodoptera exigua TaxID=7107 RepID=A0A835L1V4_SPOEX|nr:hypothetical protein HW555_008292 [Spodoptera exigua]